MICSALMMGRIDRGRLMASLETAAGLVQIPASAIPEYGVTIISYIQEDGQEMFGFATHGNASNRSSLIGLMNMCSHYIMHEDDE
jgi:hypothetical protein